MNDTPPEIEERIIEFFRNKTPVERFKMGCEMYDTSRYLIEQAILRENPGISKSELKQRVFLCFYGDEFTQEEKVKILARLAKSD